jgi:hypothetical protein
VVDPRLGTHSVEYIDCAAMVIPIDHHRPGDPGFGRPPAEFVEASSIGQVVRALALNWWVDAGVYSEVNNRGFSETWHAPLSPEHILVAAADHCLGAAYRGECPGVDPNELMRWRAESRSAFQGCSVEELLRRISAAKAELEAAEQVVLLGLGDMPHTADHDWSKSVCDGCNKDPISVCDMRRETPVPELPEAAMRHGYSYVSGPLRCPDGRKKITCSGTPEVIRAFLETWAQREGLVDCYGDPERGFAGGYLTQ